MLARSDLAEGGAIVDGGCELRDMDGEGQTEQDLVHSAAPLAPTRGWLSWCSHSHSQVSSTRRRQFLARSLEHLRSHEAVPPPADDTATMRGPVPYPILSSTRLLLSQFSSWCHLRCRSKSSIAAFKVDIDPLLSTIPPTPLTTYTPRGCTPASDPPTNNNNSTRARHLIFKKKSRDLRKSQGIQLFEAPTVYLPLSPTSLALPCPHTIVCLFCSFVLFSFLVSAH